ncbi:hypothetical protein HDU85_006545 [Gaertneriomyces sp. JEL0708]|nr:hypothetical protein HDU85_006545 [Gaertneriomyces sp. JEL0708]
MLADNTPSEINHAQEVIINAPPSKVRAALLDFDSYKLWNPFMVSVKAVDPNRTGNRLALRFDDGKTRVSTSEPREEQSLASSSLSTTPRRLFYSDSNDEKPVLTESTVSETSHEKPIVAGVTLLDIEYQTTPDGPRLIAFGNKIESNSPTELSWSHSRVTSWLFEGHQRFEFQSINDGRSCRLIHSERYTGAFAHLAQWAYSEQLRRGFELMNRSLKQTLESDCKAIA